MDRGFLEELLGELQLETSPSAAIRLTSARSRIEEYHEAEIVDAVFDLGLKNLPSEIDTLLNQPGFVALAARPPDGPGFRFTGFWGRTTLWHQMDDGSIDDIEVPDVYPDLWNSCVHNNWGHLVLCSNDERLAPMLMRMKYEGNVRLSLLGTGDAIGPRLREVANELLNIHEFVPA